jgi:hypothetical protein
VARKRLIRPEFFTHYELYEAEASSGYPLRVAFAGLWTVTDKRGIFRWRPRELKLAVLPFDDVEFAAVLDVLAEAGFVVRYEVDGESYGFIPSFQKHQTFHRLEKPSEDPPPPVSVCGTDDLLNGCQPSGWIPRAVREEVYRRDRNRCVTCKATKGLAIDHIIPYSKGGTNEVENLQVLCRRCNGKKGAKLLQGDAMTPQSPVAVAVPVTDAVAVPVTDTASSETVEPPRSPFSALGPNGGETPEAKRLRLKAGLSAMMRGSATAGNPDGVSSEIA